MGLVVAGAALLTVGRTSAGRTVDSSLAPVGTVASATLDTQHLACETSITWTVYGAHGEVTRHRLGPRLTVATGQRFTLSADPRCGLNLRTELRTSGLLKAAAGAPSPGYIALTPGTVDVLVIHGMCDGNPDTACRGGVAMDGYQLIDVNAPVA